MKIIGKTENGFIIEATCNDVAALEGLYNHEKRFEIGDMIDMDKLFTKFNSIRIALNDINNLKKSAQLIIDSANWVENFRKE